MRNIKNNKIVKDILYRYEEACEICKGDVYVIQIDDSKAIRQCGTCGALEIVPNPNNKNKKGKSEYGSFGIRENTRNEYRTKRPVKSSSKKSGHRQNNKNAKR